MIPVISGIFPCPVIIISKSKPNFNAIGALNYCCVGRVDQYNVDYCLDGTMKQWEDVLEVVRQLSKGSMPISVSIDATTKNCDKIRSQRSLPLRPKPRHGIGKRDKNLINDILLLNILNCTTCDVTAVLATASIAQGSQQKFVVVYSDTTMTTPSSQVFN